MAFLFFRQCGCLILLGICLVSQCYGKEGLFHKIDAMPLGEERAQALASLYSRNYRNSHTYAQLEERYPSEANFLKDYPAQHARVVRTLAALAFFQERDEEYAALRAMSLDLYADSLSQVKLVYQEVDLISRQGNIKLALQKLDTLYTLIQPLMHKKGIQVHVIRYFTKTMTALSLTGNRETLIQKREEFLEYIEPYVHELSNWALRRISHINSMAIKTEIQFGNLFNAVQYMMYSIDRGWIKPENIGDTQGNFYWIGASLFAKLGEAERAKAYQDAFNKRGAEGLERAVQINTFNAKLSMKNQDWTKMKKELAQLQERVEALPRLRGFAYINWLSYSGDYHFHLGQIDSAIHFMERQLAISTAFGLRVNRQNALYNLGKYYSKINRPEKAIEYFEHSLSLAKKIDNPLRISACLEKLIKVYRFTATTKKLLETQNALLQHKAEIEYRRDDKTKVIAYLEESEKKILQLQLLQENEIRNQERIEQLRRNLKVWISVFILIVLLCSGGILLLRKRQAGKMESLSVEKEDLKEKVTKLEAEKANIAEINQANSLQVLELKEKIMRLAKEVEDQDPDTSQPGNSGAKLSKKLTNIHNHTDAWAEFLKDFKALHPEFIPYLRKTYPQITDTYMRYCVCQKIGLSLKETASLLNVTVGSVKDARWRLKKIFQLDRKTSLKKFIEQI